MPPPDFWNKSARIEVVQVKEKKMGRPTENPKPYRAVVRFDKECKDILENYCVQKEVNQMEAIRRGIKKLKDDLN